MCAGSILEPKLANDTITNSLNTDDKEPIKFSNSNCCFYMIKIKES